MLIYIDVYAMSSTGVIPNNHELEAVLYVMSAEAINLIKAHRKHRKAVRKGQLAKADRRRVRLSEASEAFDRSNPSLLDRSFVLHVFMQY